MVIAENVCQDLYKIIIVKIRVVVLVISKAFAVLLVMVGSICQALDRKGETERRLIELGMQLFITK